MEVVVGDLISHPVFGFGVVTAVGSGSFQVDFAGPGLKEVSRSFTDVRKLGKDGDVQFRDLLHAFKFVLENENLTDARDEIGERWAGGTLFLKPGKSDTKGKEIPVEKFLQKIIMVRERLRVLEQKINNCPSLSSEEKVEFQQYITRCYGSLTTFNVLFRYRDSWFVGEGKDSD